MFNRLRKNSCFLFFFLLFRPFSGFSDPLPVPSASGGIVDKEIEQQYETKELTIDKPLPLVEVDIPDPKLNLPEDVKVFVRQIDLHGNELFPNDKKIQEILKSYEGRDLSIKDIYEVCSKIQARYAKEGYFLVRVYPPAQEIHNGQLRIEVLEATLGTVEVTGNRFYKTSFITSYVKKFIGKTVNYNDLLKALLLLNENTDLKVETVFQKGKQFGTVDMVLRVQDKRPIHINADWNNYGSKTTSVERLGLRADIGNTLFNGDTLSLIGVMGFPFNALRFVDAIYNVPFNARGSDLELSYLYSDFEVNQQRQLDLNGTTEVGAGKFIQALQRTSRFNSNIYTAFEYKQIHNFSGSATEAFDKLRVLSLGYNLDYADSGGRLFADVGVFGGIPNFLNGLASVDSLCSRKGAGGRFIYVDASLQRIQRLPASLMLFLNLQGQASFYKLPLSEEFYIGGINTVRGYPLASALGDSGFALNIELRVPPPFRKYAIVPFTKKRWWDSLQIIGFVDHGEVYAYGGGIENQTSRVFMTSAGLGARIFGPWNIDFNADVGFPLVHSDILKRNNVYSTAIFYFKLNVRFL